MKRSYNRTQKKTVELKPYRINQEIRVPQVRLIDEISGKTEVMSTYLALQRAEELDLDLIEVSPQADPPVVKIMDYGKFQYQREKILRKQKATQHKVDIKGIRLTARMSRHDFEVRLNNAEKFLTKGDKVKIELLLKGREQQHGGIAEDMVKNFINELSAKKTIMIEQPVKRLGRSISAVVAPKNG